MDSIPELNLSGEINRKMLSSLIRFLGEHKSKSKLKIVFDSGGGSVMAAFQMYDQLRLHPAYIVGEVFHASSAATIIVQACDHRIAYTHSLMALHYGQAGIDLAENEWISGEKITRMLSEVMAGMKMYDAIILKRGFKGTQENLDALYKVNAGIIGNELLTLGLVDEIVDTVGQELKKKPE